MQRQQRSALSLLALVCLGAGAQVASAAAAAGAEAAKASAASLVPNMAQMQQAAEAANNFIATVKTLKNTVDKVPALGNYLNRTLEQIPGIDKLSVLGDGVQLSDLGAINLPTSLEDLKSLKLPAFDFKAVEGGKVALNLTGIADKFGVDLGAMTEQFKDSKLGEIASVPADQFNKLPKGVRQALVWVTVANVVGAAGIKSVGGAKAVASKMGISGGAVLSLLAGKGAGGTAEAAPAVAAAAEPVAAAATGLPRLSAPKFDLKAIAGKFGIKVDGGAEAEAAAAAAAAAAPMMGADGLPLGGPSAFDAPLAGAGALKPESGRAFLPASVVHDSPQLCGCPGGVVAPVCTGRNLDFDSECLARCTGARVILPGTCAEQAIQAVSRPTIASADENTETETTTGSPLPSAARPSLSAAAAAAAGGLLRKRVLTGGEFSRESDGAAANVGGRSFGGLSRGARLLLSSSPEQQEEEAGEGAAAGAGAVGGGGVVGARRRELQAFFPGGSGGGRVLSPRALSALRLAATAARAAGGQYAPGLSPGGEAEAAPPRRASMRVSLRAGASGDAPGGGGGGGTSAAAAPAAWRPEVEQSLLEDGRETLGETSYVAEGATVEAKVRPAPPSVVDGLKAQVKARTGR